MNDKPHTPKLAIPILCQCGSGRPSEPLYDARGIYLGKCCAECREAVEGSYRPEVLTNPSYWADEPIDP